MTRNSAQNSSKSRQTNITAQILSIVCKRCNRPLYTVSQKNCKIVLSELCQTSTNFDNFGHKDNKEAKIMQDPLIFHLT